MNHIMVNTGSDAANSPENTLNSLPQNPLQPNSGGSLVGRYRLYLIWTYLGGSVAALAVTFFLIFLGFDFAKRQWLDFLVLAVFIVPLYTIPDVYLIMRQIRRIAAVLKVIDSGAKPASSDTSRAIVDMLNLPFHSFLRVTLFHGPSAAVLVAIGMASANHFLGSNWATWQIVGLTATVIFFAGPAHAICEFFIIATRMTPDVEMLWQYCDRIEPEHRRDLIAIRLKSKLLYMSIFVTLLPLVFLAATVLFKTDLMLSGLGIETSLEQMGPLLSWVAGVVVACVIGVLAMSILTAAEVSRSASRLSLAMRAVENGDLSVILRATTTDEYAELYRGFNLMVGNLREEAQILALSHDLAGELDLDVLLARIMHATTELLDADRSTLFLHDRKTGELFSRVAEGLSVKEIRFRSSAGIAGAVFSSGKTENIADPYHDPRFNKDVDRRTGYRTESMLTMPIINKADVCIGVTQVLNKRGGKFTSRDESRLGAFTAQIAVALENAKLFEDVLREKNYNDSILRSTSDGIVTLDAQDTILTANEAALRIFEHAREEVVNRPAGEFFKGDDVWVLQNIDKVRNGGNREITVGAELKLDKKDPTSVNLAVNPLLDAEGEHLGSMIVLEDITSEKRMKNTMARYMSPAVADQLLAGGESVLGGKDQKVSILFSDVRDFTTVSEALGARETVSMLNQYFERMVDVVLSNRGVLDKFIGDAIMALFGVPFNGERDADDAVRVANGMFRALSLLNAQRVAGGVDAIGIGVGISTGVVVVGNIGSPKRMEYTVIGDPVNLASRLEGVTKTYGSKVLISEATRLELKEQHLLREIDLLRVKGKHEPVAIYEAMDHFTDETFPNLQRAVVQFNEGIRCYRGQRWNDAIACFQEVLSLNPDDRPSKVFVERAEIFRQTPPSPDWDGVWVMTEK
jgi:adenylate cyclase